MSACSLERHRAEVDAVLAPLLARPRAGESELEIGDPELHGRVTARACRAARPVPAFDNSQMDGYAVRAADLASASPEAPVRLPVGVAAPAGAPQAEHRPGTATPVMTGAPIPRGADAVVPIEEADPAAFPRLVRPAEARSGAAPEGVAAFSAPIEPGRFVRRQGEDLGAGAEVVPAGARLTATRIGALAAAGIERVAVVPRPRVLLVTTGDEVAAGAGSSPGADPGDGRIHDANGPMLAAALRAAGCEVRALHASDAPGSLLALLAGAAPADLVVTAGGISAGAFEVVREALAPLGCEFHGVALQPGGPQGYGLVGLAEGAEPMPVLCFPGNPVSSYLSAELFLLPALRRLAGLPPERATVARILAHDVESPVAKHQLRRGTLDPDGRVRVSPPGSHLVAELAAAEVLVHLPVGVARAAEGSPVDTWSINDD